MSGSVATLVALVVAFVGLRIASSLIAAEAKGWTAVISRSLLKGAVEQLPEKEQDRWKQEWGRELEAKSDRPLTAVWYALGIRLSAKPQAAALLEGLEENSSTCEEDPFIERFTKEVEAIRSQFEEGYITASELRSANFSHARLLSPRDRTLFLIRTQLLQFPVTLMKQSSWRWGYRARGIRKRLRTRR